MTSLKKIYYLEGFRGLAAFIVVIAHYMQFYYYNPLFRNPDTSFEFLLSKTPINLFYNGNFAVFSFFVLSGYVLSIKFFREKNFEIIQASAAKRYIRLAIPVLFSVIFAYILLITNSYDLFTKYTGDVRYEEMSHNFFEMIKITLYDIFFNYSNAYNGVLWTMTYELFGSFIVFSFMALFGLNRKRYLAYAIIIILFWDSYFLAFILGMLLSDINHSPVNHKIIPKKKPIITFFMFILGIYFASYPYGSTNNSIYDVLKFSFLDVEFRAFYHILGAFFMIIAILNSEILQSFFSRKILLYLGRISFSLYLVHFPIITSLSFYIFDIVREQYSYHVSFIITFIISITITFVLSHYVSKFVDEKAIIISNRFYHRFVKTKEEQKVK